MRTKTRQVWVCSRCGWRYESPAVVERAYCPKHLGGQLPMRLEQPEREQGAKD